MTLKRLLYPLRWLSVMYNWHVYRYSRERRIDHQITRAEHRWKEQT